MTEAALDFSEEEVQKMLENIDAFSSDEVMEIDRIVDELSSRKQNELAFNDLIEAAIDSIERSIAGIAYG